MKSELKKELLIGLGVITFAVILAASGLYWFSGSVAAEVEKISQNRAIVDQRAKSIEILAQLKTNTRNIDEYQKYMSDLLPTEDELLNFSKFIDSTGRINQVNATVGFQGAAVPPTDTGPGYIAFSLEVTGSYPSIATFLDQIESKSSKFILAIDALDTTRNDANYRSVAHGKVFFQ